MRPGRSRPSTTAWEVLARDSDHLCVQCMAGAMASGATATGARTWLVARYWHLFTPRCKRAITGALITAGVLSAGLSSARPLTGAPLPAGHGQLEQA